MKDVMAERDRLIHQQRNLLIQAGAALEVLVNEDELVQGHIIFIEVTLQQILQHLKDNSPNDSS